MRTDFAPFSLFGKKVNVVALMNSAKVPLSTSLLPNSNGRSDHAKSTLNMTL